MKAIINGKIILKDRIVEDRILLYSDVFEGIVSKENMPKNAEIIDAKGGYVAPGLIDLHIHGYLGKGVCDGDVTALAGAMDLDDNSVLGIAMGTSEAGGYVDPDGNITGWLNELAFVPVDYSKEAMVDE